MLETAKRILHWGRHSLRSAFHWGSVLRISSRLGGSPKYLHYLSVQREKSMRYCTRKSSRTPQLITKFLDSLSWSAQQRRQAAVLCIGCRNTYELDQFQQAGFGRVEGVDLFSHDPRVLVMDMHALEFPDNHFDVVYTCHSLEHSYDPHKAVTEWMRVTKPHGACVVEVPVRFQKSATDLQDFGSVQGVRQLFEPHVDHVLFAEEAREDSGEEVARLAFQMKRAA